MDGHAVHERFHQQEPCGPVPVTGLFLPTAVVANGDLNNSLVVAGGDLNGCRDRIARVLDSVRERFVHGEQDGEHPILTCTEGREPHLERSAHHNRIRRLRRYSETNSKRRRGRLSLGRRGSAHGCNSAYVVPLMPRNEPPSLPPRVTPLARGRAGFRHEARAMPGSSSRWRRAVRFGRARRRGRARGR